MVTFISTLVAFGLDPIALNFVFGILAASLFEVIQRHDRHRRIWSISAAALGVLLCIAWISEPSFPTWIQGPLGATLVLSLAMGHEMRNRWISGLGETSYSTYLVQVFTIPLTLAILKIEGLHPLAVQLTAVLALIITQVVGVAVHRQIDSKIQIFLRKFSR